MAEPVLVELFTSQGCSSCPPADQVLSELAQREDVVAIACHVTYWNYLGWKDTFSSDYCDNRQRYYGKRFGAGRIYTPQAVVNGHFETVGSYRERINHAVDKASQGDGPTEIKLILDSSGERDVLVLGVNEMARKRSVRLDVVGIGDQFDQAIRRGENGGRTLHYSHPVLAHYRIDKSGIEDLPKIGGTLRQAVAGNDNIKTWVAIANDEATGVVVAVGRLSVETRTE